MKITKKAKTIAQIKKTLAGLISIGFIFLMVAVVLNQLQR